MSARPPIFHTVSNMELDIRDVECWGQLISLLGSSLHSVDPGALHVAGVALKALGKRLEEQWSCAFELAKGLS